MSETMKEENLVQCDCLRRLKGEVIEHIDNYAAELREIIEGFKAKYNRVPTGEDLVYILCEHHGRDLTKEQ